MISDPGDIPTVRHWLYLNRNRLGVEVPRRSDEKFKQMAAGLVDLYRKGKLDQDGESWRRGAREGFQQG